MTVIYLVDNGLTAAAEEIVALAHTLGLRPTVFHSYSAFLDYRSVLSQALNEKSPDSPYPDYSDWIAQAHAVIHLHAHGRGYHVEGGEGQAWRISAHYHLKRKPVNPDRVLEILVKLLGPGLDGASLRSHHEERFKENFCQVLAERFGDWARRQKRSEAKEPSKNEPFGNETRKKQLGQFFEHCPFCGALRIRVQYCQSSPDTWRHLAGRAGYFVTCRACREHIHFAMTAMS